MKKVFGILLSLQIALLVFFTAPLPAQAQWERDSYRESRERTYDYQNNRGNWKHREHHNAPFMWNMKHVNNKSIALMSLYKLAVDVVLSILFIMFFSKLIMRVFTRMTTHPFKTGYVGFTFLIIFPLISVILLGLLWLGIAGLLTYGLIFLTGLFLAKVFIGWFILNKLEKGYILDWKAGLAGPLVMFVLLFIPILGWMTVAIILAMATGAFLKELMPLLERQALEHKAPKK